MWSEFPEVVLPGSLFRGKCACPSMEAPEAPPCIGLDDSADATYSRWSSHWDSAALPCCLDGLLGLDSLRSVYTGASQDDVFVPDGRRRPNRG